MASLPIGVTSRQGILALAAGLLGAAAYWPLSLWPLLLVSVALFLRLLRDQNVQVARNLGLVYGLAFAAGTMYRLFRIFGGLAVPLLVIMAAPATSSPGVTGPRRRAGGGWRRCGICRGTVQCSQGSEGDRDCDDQGRVAAACRRQDS
jgi:hypothetical protein